MDRLDAMATLLAVVDTGSLSGASRRLGTPLTTVSRKIADLERHLGIRLLNRSTRKVQATDAGRSYILACRRILEDVGEAERAAIGEYSAPRGDLARRSPPVARCLPRRLARALRGAGAFVWLEELARNVPDRRP